MCIRDRSHVFARHFFAKISLDVTISASCNWSIAVFTTSLESQESYLTLRNVTLQTRRSNTRDFFRQHSTFARLYNAAASPASHLRSAGSLAISTNRRLSEDCVRRSRMTSCHFEVWIWVLTTVFGNNPCPCLPIKFHLERGKRFRICRLPRGLCCCDLKTQDLTN